MHDELSAGTDGSVIAADHAEGHGIVGSLGHVLHLPQSGIQPGRGGQPRLLGTLLQVSEEELVLTDPLDGLDEVGVDALSLLQPLLDLLWVDGRGVGGVRE